MMAVDDEARVPEFHGDDRWITAIGKGIGQRPKTVAAEVVKGLEVARECRRLSPRSPPRDRAGSPGLRCTGGQRLQPLFNVFELEQAGLATWPEGPHHPCLFSPLLPRVLTPVWAARKRLDDLAEHDPLLEIGGRRKPASCASGGGVSPGGATAVGLGSSPTAPTRCSSPARAPRRHSRPAAAGRQPGPAGLAGGSTKAAPRSLLGGVRSPCRSGDGRPPSKRCAPGGDRGDRCGGAPGPCAPGGHTGRRPSAE